MWLPLPFGSVTPLGSTVAWVLAFLAGALALQVVEHRSSLHPVVAPAAALVALSALGGIAAVAGSRAVTAEEGTTAVFASIAPHASLDAAVACLALAALLVAAGISGRRRRCRRWLGGALLLGALFQALFGAQKWLTRDGTIWGRTVAGDASRLRGSFVNSDHLALYLEIALACAFALGWWAWRRGRRTTLEARLLWVGGPTILWLTLFVALAFSGSRAGLLAGIGATAGQGIVVALTARRRRRALAGALAIAAGLAAVAWIGFHQGFGRFLATSAYDLPQDARTQVYRAGVELWSRYPLLGTGLGTFGAAFPLVQPSGVGGYWRHLHNDWLELLVTTGVVGLGVVVGGLGALVVRLRRVALFGHRGEDRAAGIAALGALCAAAIHSFFDFGLTLPAISCTLVIVVGAAAGAHTVAPARGESAES